VNVPLLTEPFEVVQPNGEPEVWWLDADEDNFDDAASDYSIISEIHIPATRFEKSAFQKEN